MFEVIREEGETIDHLLRRYNDKLRRLNFFETVKSGDFYQKPGTKRQRRKSALYRNRKREYMEYLKKIGKLEESPHGGYYYSGRAT